MAGQAEQPEEETRKEQREGSKTERSERGSRRMVEVETGEGSDLEVGRSMQARASPTSGA